MGAQQSKSDGPQFVSEPWRKINWEDKQSALKYVQDYKPLIEGQQLRILLHGPIGAGKSSFIHSVNSVLQQRMCTLVPVDNISGDSFTQKFTTYKIQKGSPDSFYPFVFNDTMGLDARSNVLVDNVKLALKGHVKNGYVFNPRSKLSEGDPFYNQNPSSSDKVHVLVCVVPADTAAAAQGETMKKLRKIRLEARNLGIPQVAIITKIDKVCPEIRDDLKNVYKIRALKQKMEQFSVDVGIPMNCIFPVKNYHEEINLNNDNDILILSTLRHLINYGEDFINFKRLSAMGAPQSKPWREIDWTDKQSALKCVQDYKPNIEGQQLRILLHGPVGAGKSSFINSVKSVLRQRMCTLVPVDNTSGDSFTQKFTTYKIQKVSPDSFYPFVFNDIMGLEARSDVLVDDVKLTLKGHVKNGYVFNPRSKLSEGDPFYNQNPSSNDKVHVLVCVVPADTADVVKDEVVKKIQEIRLEARNLGIPQVAIITKIDMVCPELRDDLKNVYKTRALKKKMEQFSADVGIPMNCIFPVKNYHEEIGLDNDIDLLILSTLSHILNFGDDFINFKHQSEQSDTYACLTS